MVTLSACGDDHPVGFASTTRATITRSATTAESWVVTIAEAISGRYNR